MKKLRNKVFLVIFSILTIFTFTMFAMSTTRTYIERKKTISDILNRIPKTVEIEKNRDNLNFPSIRSQREESRRIFLDFTIYTIVLDDNGEYQELVNNTSFENIDEDNIKSIANDIVKNHKESVHIGNLYSEKYSYAFTSNNTLVIMDNTETNSMLLSQLFSNILLFIFCEIIIFIISALITKWIITPVKKSFEKQKAFVADASHELKTPLSVMIASADAYFNDKDEKWIHNMKNESERMINLVTELLDLASMEQEQEVIMSNNNLSDIINGSILTFESLFYDNKIKEKDNIEPNIEFVCNENLIIELMSILIDNAIKHCNEKRIVKIDLYKKGKQILLDVKNTGEPINKEDEEKIFERFYKVDSSRNRNSNNYGLGLAIAKNIVERHNGSISASSDKGFTTFRIIFNQK